jgi:predicted methyltransferase
MVNEKDVLLNLLRLLSKDISLNQTRRLLKMRKDTFTILLKQAIESKFLEKKNNCYLLTTRAHQLIKKDNSNFFRCNCNGGFKIPRKLLLKAKEYCKLRVVPNVKIDQCPTTPEDLACRVAFMYENGDLSGKRIFCIGDNDFASLLMFEIGKPKEVVVIDIDDRVLATIKKVSKNQKWVIKTKKFDIQKFSKENCPKDLENRFDVFQTDPPYTEVGFKYYLALGMVVLKRKGACYVVAPHMNLEDWSDELLYKIEKFLLEHGFLITDILSSFQSFIDKYGIISSIIRAERTNLIREPFSALKQLNIDKFYTIR